MSIASVENVIPIEKLKLGALNSWKTITSAFGFATEKTGKVLKSVSENEHVITVTNPIGEKLKDIGDKAVSLAKEVAEREDMKKGISIP